MVRKLPICLSLLLTSCIAGPRYATPPERIAHITLYGMPLIATTKLPISDNIMQDSAFLLSQIVNPGAFIAQLHRALAHKKRYNKQVFDFYNIRMVYAIVDQENKKSTLVLSRGGVEMYYDQYVYQVDEEIAQVIAQFLPEAATLKSETDRRYYQKQKYTPLECCR